MGESAVFTLPLLGLTAADYGYNHGYTSGQAEFDLPLLQLEAVGTLGATVSFELPLFELETRVGATVDFELPGLELIASASTVNTATAAFVLPLITTSGRSGAMASFNLPLVELSASGSQTNSVSAEFNLPSLTMVAEAAINPRAVSTFNLPIISLVASATIQSNANASFDLPVIELGASGAVGTLASSEYDLPLLQLNTTGYVNSVGNASFILPLFVLESHSTGGIIITSQVDSLDPDETFAISLNLTNRSVSEYSNYKFNSMTYFNGKYLGANSGGIFSLDGDDDAGTDIVAKIRTGLDSLDSFNLKRVWGVYLSHNGKTMRIKTTSSTDDYETIAGTKNRSGIAVQKFKTQRTKRDGYWGVEIENVDGGDFTIEGLEVVCELLSRRAV